MLWNVEGGSKECHLFKACTYVENSEPDRTLYEQPESRHKTDCGGSSDDGGSSDGDGDTEINYTKINEDALTFTNQVRQDPTSIVQELKDMLPRFEGNLYRPPAPGIPMMTNEGASAV